MPDEQARVACALVIEALTSGTVNRAHVEVIATLSAEAGDDGLSRLAFELRRRLTRDLSIIAAVRRAARDARAVG